MVVRRLSNDELYHHGILGQRWGVRRYQNKDGSLTSAGRKRKGLLTSIKDKRKMKKLREAKEAKKKEKLQLEETINSGDYGRIKKVQHKLTDEEYVRALQRINYNETLKNYETERRKAQLEKGIRFLNTTSTIAKTVSDVSNSAANVKTALENMGLIEKKKNTLELSKYANALKAEQVMSTKYDIMQELLNDRTDQEAVDSILGIKRKGKDGTKTFKVVDD